MGPDRTLGMVAKTLVNPLAVGLAREAEWLWGMHIWDADMTASSPFRHRVVAALIPCTSVRYGGHCDDLTHPPQQAAVKTTASARPRRSQPAIITRSDSLVVLALDRQRATLATAWREEPAGVVHFAPARQRLKASSSERQREGYGHLLAQ